MARDAKIFLQPDQTLAEVNEAEISDSNARGRDRGSDITIFRSIAPTA